MMVLSALRPDADLAEFLAYRARSAPAARLGAEAVAGLAMAAAAGWWHPPAHLVIVTSAVCFSCYAFWGLLDRARSRATGRAWGLVARLLRVACVVFVAIGVLAGAGVLLAIWALALGTWIS